MAPTPGVLRIIKRVALPAVTRQNLSHFDGYWMELGLPLLKQLYLIAVGDLLIAFSQTPIINPG
jgi:hypothetical protein